jgi:O-antigen chain-terminating methyltransferase
MVSEDGSNISIEEIMHRIKEEAAKRGSAESGTVGMGIAGAGGAGEIDFPKQKLELLINDARYKSQTRTKIPNALNRFPVNKSKLLQKIILKFYELLFREQRAINNEMLDAIQEFTVFQSKAADAVNGLRSKIAGLEERFIGMDGKIAGLGESIAGIDGKIAGLEESIAGIDGKIAGLDENISKTNRDIFRQIKDHKLNIVDMQRRLMLLLEEARKRLPESETYSALQIKNMLKEEDHIFDAMYVTFEDKFRGTRQDIKNRQNVYIPYIDKAVKTNAPDKQGAQTQIIDVGCGRGEWLELLKENGFNAKGIDLNEIMVGTCKEHNFDAVQSDAVEYLRSLPAASLCAVTGFHIIEHLPFKTLIALLDESFRVLKQGGVIIFETPNPENLLVGACTFYTDPSHIKPLVPAAVQFIAEERGFSDVEIKRLHKYSDYLGASSAGGAVEEESSFIAKNFYNEMDYAVIGTKL